MEKKHYNLALPVELFASIEEVVEDEQSTILAIILRFIKLGLLLHSVAKRGGKVLIQQGEDTREIVII